MKFVVPGLSLPAGLSEAILRPAVKARCLAHAFVAFVVWPLITIAGAAIEAGGMPYYHLPLHHAILGSAAGVILLAADFAVVGLGLMVVSVAIFSRFGSTPADKTPSFRHLCVEPLSLLAAVFCGTSLWYPTVLSQAALVPFWSLPAWLVLTVCVFVAGSLAYEVAPRHGRLRLVLVLGAVGCVAPMPSLVVGTLSVRERQPTDVVLLGVDSLSQVDDVAPLRGWVEAHAGTWYGQAVSPGLVTNAVWASVMTMQPVHRHGVFHAFQPLPSGEAPLVRAAKQAGYHTISVFPDQTTCAIGSEAGFDEDRGGPLGWRQLAVATVQNSSLLLPLFTPILPWAPWGAAPPNQAGTFTYDLRREIRELLTSGQPNRRTFLAAHLTYLHIPTYPRSIDLSWPELRRVALASAGSLRDRSFDWDDVDLATDPVQLRRWKVARLQSVIAEESDSSGFLESGGKLLVFSDHGDRSGLTPQTFSDRRYHHVVLAAVGLPAFAHDRPTSLIDIGAILGLIRPDATADPIVEFAIGPRDTWLRLAETSRIHWSGRVELDATLLHGIFQGLRMHRPWMSADATAGTRHPATIIGSLRPEPRSASPPELVGQ